MPGRAHERALGAVVARACVRAACGAGRRVVLGTGRGSIGGAKSGAKVVRKSAPKLALRSRAWTSIGSLGAEVCEDSAFERWLTGLAGRAETLEIHQYDRHVLHWYYMDTALVLHGTGAIFAVQVVLYCRW